MILKPKTKIKMIKGILECGGCRGFRILDIGQGYSLKVKLYSCKDPMLLTDLIGAALGEDGMPVPAFTYAYSVEKIFASGSTAQNIELCY